MTENSARPASEKRELRSSARTRMPRSAVCSNISYIDHQISLDDLLMPAVFSNERNESESAQVLHVQLFALQREAIHSLAVRDTSQGNDDPSPVEELVHEGLR